MIILASLERYLQIKKQTNSYRNVTLAAKIYGKNYRNCKSERRGR